MGNENEQATPPLTQTVEESPLGESFAHIGRYALLRKLGEGAMGVVYAAYDEDLDRKVAIKVVHPSHQQDRELRQRMVREAQALARVSAPNVVQVYEVGEIHGQMYIVMEFVRGTTLTQWHGGQSRSWQETLLMYSAAGQGLLAAHDAGLTHRDFKPDNVLVGSDGRPRVADFGLALVAGAAEGQARSDRRDDDLALDLIATTPRRPAMTNVGVAVGTPLYMSPEQHQGRPADGRSDQFSFCVALYEALYGYVPFAGENMAALRYNVLTGKVRPRPEGSPVPQRVHQALLRGLACDPQQRFPSMRELLVELHFDEEHDPAAVPAARRSMTVILSFGVIAYVSGLWGGRLLGLDPLRSANQMSIAFLLVMSLLAWWWRRVLVSNRFHRTMIITGLVFAVQFAGERLAGLFLGMPASQVFVIDLISMASMCLLISLMVLPQMWPFFILLAGAAIVSIYWPEHAGSICNVSTPATVLVIIVRWNRAAASSPKAARAAA